MSGISHRFWLVSVSIVAHLAAGITMFATGVWRLERLDSDYKMAGIAMLTPPAPSGSPAALPEQTLIKKQTEKKIIKEPTQPVIKKFDTEVTTAVTAKPPGSGNGDDGDGLDNGTGPGDDKDGTCTTLLCGEQPTIPTAPPELPKVPSAPRNVAPKALQEIRISGDTQIHPPDVTKTQMLRDGRDRSVGVLKVCVSASGTISSVSIIASTKYEAFDASLLRGVRSWRYRPYTVDGLPIAVCGMVSFVYSIK